MQKAYECLKVDLLFIPNIFKIDNFEKIVQKSNNSESYFMDLVVPRNFKYSNIPERSDRIINI